MHRFCYSNTLNTLLSIAKKQKQIQLQVAGKKLNNQGKSQAWKNIFWIVSLSMEETDGKMQKILSNPKTA